MNDILDVSFDGCFSSIKTSRDFAISGVHMTASIPIGCEVKSTLVRMMIVGLRQPVGGCGEQGEYLGTIHNVTMHTHTHPVKWIVCKEIKTTNYIR